MAGSTQHCLNCLQVFYQQSLLPLECVDFSFGGLQISLIGCFVEATAQPTISDGPKICRSCLDQLRTCYSDSDGKRSAMANRHLQRPTHICVTCGQLSPANNTLNMRLTVVNVNGQQVRLEECVNACCEQDLGKHKTSMICLGCLSVIVEDYVKQATISVEVKEEIVEMEVECKQEPELNIESNIGWLEVAETKPTLFAEPIPDSKVKDTRHQCLDCFVSYPSVRQLNYHRRSAHPTEKLSKSSKPLNYCKPATVQCQKYECTYCQKAFRRKELVKHLLTHRPDYQPKLRERFECHHCDFTVQNKRSILRHLTTAHFFKTEQRKCPICSAILDITPQHNGYKEHMLEHEANDNLQCDGCKRKFSKVESYLKHKEWNPVLFICTRCDGVGYHSVSLLESHMETVHNHIYTCEVCNKQLVTRKVLETHLEIKHAIMARLRCRKCTTEFPTSSQLQAHMEHAHPSMSHRKSGLKPLKPKLKRTKTKNRSVCHKCGKSFKGKYYMIYHLLDVHGDATHKCDQCERIFRSPRLLKRHNQIVHHLKTKPQLQLPCLECDRTFNLRSELSNHMRMHSNTACYDCKGCGMTFVRHSLLRAHMEECEKMTPEVWANLEKLEFQCQFCYASFARRTQLGGHMRGHDLPELRKFKCLICEKGFSTKKGMQAHMRHKHFVQP